MWWVLVFQLILYLLTYLAASGCCCHFITMVVILLLIPVPYPSLTMLLGLYVAYRYHIIRGIQIVDSPVIHANVVLYHCTVLSPLDTT